jgi:hypothetical protein
MRAHFLFPLTALLVLSTALPATANTPRVVVHGFQSDDSALSHHLSASALSLGDDTIDPESTATLGGPTWSFRWDLARWGGLEFSASALNRKSEGGLVTENRSLAAVNWLWYFGRRHDARWYVITGIAGLHTNLEVGANTYRFDEKAFTLGAGFDWALNDNWILSADARTLFLSADHSKPFDADESFSPNDGRERQPYPIEWTAPPAKRDGAQFSAGIGYRW